jgi:tRNA/rRNA methyltransferase
MGENIGAAARAMLNFGLTELRLVAPRDGWPSEQAKANAAGALEMMSPVQVFESLQEAISDLHYVLATTSRPRDMVKPVFTPGHAARELSERKNKNEKTGILFGAERTGLLNEEIMVAQGIITFPVNPEFFSLNIAQAVLLMAYECQKTESNTIPKTMDLTPAPLGELENFLTRLETELETSNFFKTPDSKPTLIRSIRNMFTRHQFTIGEINMLHGIISALKGK